MKSFRKLYGESPLSLLAMLASFAITGYAVWRVHLGMPRTEVRIGVWFAAAAIGHDLVLYPLYALADRSLVEVTRRRRPRARVRRAIPLVNYVRVPALGSGLLLLVFLGPILKESQASFQYAASSQVDQGPFLGRWLAITAALFAASAVSYAVRLGRDGRPKDAAAQADPVRLQTGPRA